MKPKYIEVKMNKLFRVKSGDFHALEQLEAGDVPLIACGVLDNGFVGNYDIPADKTYYRAVTVAYNGLPLVAKFHPYVFGAKDDVAILIPRTPMKDATLFYVAALLKMLIWRYSYGRKCYREKLQNVSLLLPVTEADPPTIDENEVERVFSTPFESYIPKKAVPAKGDSETLAWKSFNITELFDLNRGDFHSIDALDDGNYMTVSRVSANNGVVGYYDRPKGAKLYERGAITVSTVGGDAFVQLDTFLSTDNVIICSPKKKWQLTSLFFICLMLNQQKWRYSYGRQCYKEKLSKMDIALPVNKKAEPDESVMEKFVTQTSYWHLVRQRFSA